MPIEQHPIPQDVAGYKFRLIGDMTLKQFIWLAGGIILGLFIYQLPLPFFFKYPLAALAVGLGAGIAFVPIEGRSMDKWLIAFIKSIYSPTQYVWKKGGGRNLPTITAVVKPVTIPTPVVPPSTPPPAKPIATSPTLQPTAPASQLPVPFTPTTPNTLVGMTLTPRQQDTPRLPHRDQIGWPQSACHQKQPARSIPLCQTARKRRLPNCHRKSRLQVRHLLS